MKKRGEKKILQLNKCSSTHHQLFESSFPNNIIIPFSRSVHWMASPGVWLDDKPWWLQPLPHHKLYCERGRCQLLWPMISSVFFIFPRRCCYYSPSPMLLIIRFLSLDAHWLTGWLLNGVIQAGCIIKRSITKLLIPHSTCTCSVLFRFFCWLVWCYVVGLVSVWIIWRHLLLISTGV